MDGARVGVGCSVWVGGSGVSVGLMGEAVAVGKDVAVRTWVDVSVEVIATSRMGAAARVGVGGGVNIPRKYSATTIKMIPIPPAPSKPSQSSGEGPGRGRVARRGRAAPEVGVILEDGAAPGDG